MDQSLIDVHATHLQSHLRYIQEERNVSSPADYFREYLGFSNIDSAYENYPLDIIYRVPSLSPAEVMIVLKNPNISESSVSSGGGTGEDILLDKYLNGTDSPEDKVEKIEDVSRIWISEWFADNHGPQARLKKIVGHGIEGGYIPDIEDKSEKQLLLPTVRKEDVDSPGEIPTDVPTEEISGFHNRFYVTELSKLRAPQNEWPFHLEEQVIAKDYLRNEIEVVDPTLVIAMGDKPRTVVKEFGVESVGENLYRLTGFEDSDRYLLVLDHPSYPPADYSPAAEAFSRLDLKS